MHDALLTPRAPASRHRALHRLATLGMVTAGLSGPLGGAALAAPAGATLGAPAGTVRKATAAEKASAAKLYGEGVGLFKQKQYLPAAEKFSAAFALDPSSILLYNLARAREENGDADEAVDHYREYLKRYPQAEDRAAVEQRVRILEAVSRKARQGRLLVSGLPAGARVLMDGGAPLYAQPAEGWALDPGEHELRIEPREGRVWVTKVKVVTGQTAKAAYPPEALVAVPVKTDPAKPPAKDPAKDPAKTPVKPDVVAETPHADSGVKTGTILGWTGVGAGALMLGLGGLFYAQAVSAIDDYDAVRKKLAAGEVLDPGARAKAERDAQDAVDTKGTLAYVMWGAGAAALGTGIVLLVLNRDKPADTTGVRLVPTLGGIGLTGTF